MLMIIFLHIFGAAYKNLGISIPATIIEGFCIIAVNCYILISGYFGIKISWKGFVKLYSICLFYGLGIMAVSIYQGNSFSFKELTMAVFPFWLSQWWFVKVYFQLFLLSPLLNFVIEKCNKTNLFFVTLLLFSWSILYFLDSIGYEIANFVVLYFIGRYMALYTTKNQKDRYKFLGLYLLFALLIGLLSFKSSRALYYNCPLVIVASVMFFRLFRTFSFHNKFVNWLAYSAFAVYLIHCNEIIMPYFSHFFNLIKVYFGDNWYFSIIVFVAATTLMFILLLFDKIRILISNSIERLVTQIPIECYID